MQEKERECDVFGLILIKCVKGLESEFCKKLYDMKKVQRSSIDFSYEEKDQISIDDLYLVAGGFDIAITISSISTRKIEEFVVKCLRTEYGDYLLDTQTLVGSKVTSLETALK